MDCRAGDACAALLLHSSNMHALTACARLAAPATGTQHGHVLCVRGAGVARPSVNGVEYGHHFFQVVLQVPSAQAASTAELQLLQQLSAVVQQQQQQDSVAGMLRQGPAQDAREQEQQQQSQDVQQQGQQAQEQPSQQQQAQEQQQRVAQRRRRRREAADGS